VDEATTIAERVPAEATVEIAAVLFSSPDGEFAIVRGPTPEGEEVVIKGALGHLGVGETITVEGRWQHHPAHGPSLVAERVRIEPPTTDRALLGYLCSIRHVGPSGAASLLQRHGEAVIEVIDRNPRSRLLEVPGIGRARIEGAVESWEERKALRAVRLFLESHGVSASVAARIYRAFGAGSIERLERDPYAITELDGVGFRTADALAQALGIPPDAPERLDAGVLFALSEAELDGHCFLPARELCRRAGELLGASVDERLEALVARGRIICEGEALYDAAMHRIEGRLAAHVQRLAGQQPAFRLRSPDRPRAGVFVPSDAQWAGLAAALEHRISILTGGPGTGKSSAMRALVGLLRADRKTVRLCAPTGKAARRLAELTGASATTIHRLLEWQPGEGFARNERNPLEGVDLLIVDEASMLGVRLATALLGAVGEHTHVLLVGDSDQLAPVGPGKVLEDLIASGAVPVTALREIFRQAARSLIVRAAHAINRGVRPLTEPEPDTERDFFLIAKQRPEEIFEEVVSLAAERLPAHYGLDPRSEIQVLAPMHRGVVGIDALNVALRARLNDDGRPVAGTPFRVGDKLIQTRNDHEHEFMNGEHGVVLDHDAAAGHLLLATDDGRVLRLRGAALETLRLAYAISIHKAQGSQAPAIVAPLFRGHQIMLTRNLIYTAVTRAERLCVLVGQPSALDLALRRRDARRRHTRLAQRVRVQA